MAHRNWHPMKNSLRKMQKNESTNSEQIKRIEELMKTAGTNIAKAVSVSGLSRSTVEKIIQGGHVKPATLDQFTTRLEALINAQNAGVEKGQDAFGGQNEEDLPFEYIAMLGTPKLAEATYTLQAFSKLIDPNSPTKLTPEILAFLEQAQRLASECSILEGRKGYLIG